MISHSSAIFSSEVKVMFPSFSSLGKSFSSTRIPKSCATLATLLPTLPTPIMPIVSSSGFFIPKRFPDQKRGLYILSHRGGIASRGICPLDTRLLAVFGVDMVKSDGCCGDKFYFAAFQQFAVAVSAGPDDECVRILYQFPCKILSRCVDCPRRLFFSAASFI